MVNYAVQVEALTVVRGGRPVLQEVDVVVRDSAITGLLGPSGCGKSTLMRSIIGTQIIRSGRVQVLGRAAGSESLRREVGYASQQASVYDDLSVRENIRYFARAVGAPQADVERVIDQVDLRRFAGRLAGQLSGGQRSRVSLGIALLGAPRLLILDEPTVGLDPVLREDLWRLFHDLTTGGLTLLVSSHVMDEAQRCDDLVLMREGRILTQGTPGELQERTGTVDMDAAFLALVTGGPQAA